MERSGHIMKTYLSMKIKQNLRIFAIPYLIEILFIVMSNIWKKMQLFPIVHTIWLLAANAVLFALVVWQTVNEYYFNNEQLTNTSSQKQRIVIALSTTVNIILLTIFGILGQYGQFLARSLNDLSLNYLSTYALDKSLSLSAFLFLISLVILIFKNINKLETGTLLILILTGTVIGIQIYYFWSGNNTHISNFLIGIVSNTDSYLA